MHPDYWTEKLADAYLGGAFPFYWGCPNVEKYFPQGALVPIDIHRPEEAISIIRKTMEEGTFEKALPLLKEAREAVLSRYNLFPTLARLLGTLPEEPPVPVTLHPEESFSLRGRVRKFRERAKALWKE